LKREREKDTEGKISEKREQDKKREKEIWNIRQGHS